MTARHEEKKEHHQKYNLGSMVHWEKQSISSWHCNSDKRPRYHRQMHFIVKQILMKCLDLRMSTIFYFDQEYFIIPRSKVSFLTFLLPSFYRCKTWDLKVYKLWLRIKRSNCESGPPLSTEVDLRTCRACFQPGLVFDPVNKHCNVALNGNPSFCSSLLLVSGRQQVKSTSSSPLLFRYPLASWHLCQY